MKPGHMIDADRRRIHGPIVPMGHPTPTGLPLSKAQSKARNRITVAMSAMALAAVILVILRSV